jgi:hypothetical protein
MRGSSREYQKTYMLVLKMLNYLFLKQVCLRKPCLFAIIQTLALNVSGYKQAIQTLIGNSCPPPPPHLVCINLICKLQNICNHDTFRQRELELIKH